MTSSIGLLDTSVVIALPHLTAADLPTYPTISAVTLAELSAGPLATSDVTERQRRQLVLQQVESAFDPIPFDASCARWFSLVATSLRESGRKSRARAFEALIASTALAHGIPLYTCNPRDFEGIVDLDIHPVTTEQA